MNSKQSPGAILASILKGENKFNEQDFINSSENFFKEKGVNATFTKPDEILKSKDKTEQSEVNNT